MVRDRSAKHVPNHTIRLSIAFRLEENDPIRWRFGAKYLVFVDPDFFVIIDLPFLSQNFCGAPRSGSVVIWWHQTKNLATAVTDLEAAVAGLTAD